MGFAENLNYCMSQRGYSAYRLAKIIGVNNQSVINWQNGKNTPFVKTRQKIADHFGITLAELDGDELPVLPPEGTKNSPDPATGGSKDALLDFVRNTDDRAVLLAVLDEVNKKLQKLK